eukprot:Ihof_evm2s346 gene=Ihof_evmTU2s346
MIRYCHDTFNEKHISTLQASFLNKTITVDRQTVTLNIWDTAGQERFHALGPIYYRESNGAILVYDITDEDSFTRVQSWVKELQTILGSNVCMIIVGNKSDLENDRVVAQSDALSYSESVGAGYIETSAKHNIGIDKLFETLTKRMVQARREKPSIDIRDYGHGLVLAEDE